MIVIGAGLVFLLLIVIVLLSFKKPNQGQVLIRTGLSGIRISFSGLIVLPLIHKAEFLDTTLTRLVMDCSGKNALLCKDQTPIDVQAAFFVRIKPTVEDVRRVVQKLGIKAASDEQILYALFGDRFHEALKQVSRHYTYDELSDREFFKDQVVAAIDSDLDGYLLDVVAINELSKSNA